MINLVWLKTFCTLGEIGHFTRTAEKLFMTQSGVSQHIKKLEQQLDTLLLIREGKSFTFTEAGATLLRDGKSILNETERLSVAVKQDEPFIGTIKLATPGSVGLQLYPHLLDIQQQHPTLIINHSFAPNKNIEQNLLYRSIDIGLLTILSKEPNLVTLKVAEEPLVLVTSKEIENINWQVLINLGFISHPDAEHHSFQLLGKNFVEFEHVSQLTHKGFSNQISLILEPVAKGFGFTVLPLYAVNAFIKQDEINIHTLPCPVSEPLYLSQNRLNFENERTKFIKQSLISALQ